MEVEDHAGVLSDITRIYGDENVSIDSINQKSADVERSTAEIVILTHPAPEAVLQQALGRLRALPSVRAVHAFIRVS